VLDLCRVPGIRASSNRLFAPKYNSVNGEHACENSALQNDFLKDELNFAGYVVSDWVRLTKQLFFSFCAP
jgi:beta-glucosidase-like glycosyl hydrolase